MKVKRMLFPEVRHEPSQLGALRESLATALESLGFELIRSLPGSALFRHASDNADGRRVEVLLLSCSYWELNDGDAWEGK
jgi:hypothetical protein